MHVLVPNCANATSRRAAIITQADVAREIRAAKQAGAASIEVRPDGRTAARLAEAAGNIRSRALNAALMTCGFFSSPISKPKQWFTVLDFDLGEACSAA